MQPSHALPRLVTGGWLSAGLLVVATMLLLAVDEPQLAHTPGLGVASVLVGVGFASTAALLAHQDHQRGNAGLFALLACVWVCSLMSKRPVGALTPAVYLVSNQVDVLAAAALLRYPASRFERPEKIFVMVSAVTAAVLQTFTLVTSTPGELGLPDVPWPDVWQSSGLSSVAIETRSAWLGASAIVFLILLIRRWVRMAPLERRTLTPVVLTAAVAGLATTPVALNVVLSAQSQEDIYLIRSYAAVAVAVAFVVSAVQMRLARSSLVSLVNDLRVPSSGSDVQAALREVLLDPDLVVLFALPGETGWYDDTGTRRELPGADARRLPIVTTTATGDPLAVILVDTRLDRYRTLVDAAVTISRFALENARLEAGLRAQLQAVREARARLLSVGLEQRRQLERDLHDGAQQRLLAIGMRLGSLEATVEDDPSTAAAIGVVRKELHVALDELRDLARGIYPAILSQAGLGPALEAVAERLPIQVDLHVEAQRWHPDVESAAYLVACEAVTNAVHHAGECTVRIDAHQESDGLHVRVADNGHGVEGLDGHTSLRTLNDRVTALGGELTVTSSARSGTIVEAVLPCV